MSLGAFIRTNLEPLLLAWEAFASELPAGARLTPEQLRDDAQALLVAYADAIDGPAPEDGARRAVHYALAHTETRLAQGFLLDAMASEYIQVRFSILAAWLTVQPDPAVLGRDTLRFTRVVDETLMQAIQLYRSRIERARELFLGALGHDLRTPLTVVVNSAHLLLGDEGMRGESTKAAARVLKAALRIKQMLTDLLDFTRTRLGTQLPVALERTDLAPLIRHTVDEAMGSHPAALIRFEFDGPLVGEWDGARISQLLGNLIANAIHHGDSARPITLHARGQADAVEVTVHNEGVPIPQESLSRIFDPLVQGPSEGDRRGRSERLGFGLYIAQEIARSHAGGIQVNSSAEAGTTFILRLPRHPVRRG